MTKKFPIVFQLLIVVGLFYYLFADIFYANSTYSKCGSGTPLPNGYNYFLPSSGNHFIGTQRASSTDTFYFINRIHVTDRYILGEVVPRSEAKQTSDDSQDRQFKYFIIDTKTKHSSGEISEAEWKEELAKVGIRHQFRLKKRSEKWHYDMCSRYGKQRDR